MILGETQENDGTYKWSYDEVMRMLIFETFWDKLKKTVAIAVYSVLFQL